MIIDHKVYKHITSIPTDTDLDNIRDGNLEASSLQYSITSSLSMSHKLCGFNVVQVPCAMYMLRFVYRQMKISWFTLQCIVSLIQYYLKIFLFLKIQLYTVQILLVSFCSVRAHIL